jgi:hypothetical protein
VAGGSVLRSLTQSEGDLKDAFKDSDVDLFLYGVSSEAAMAKLHVINDHLISRDPDVVYARTKGSVTFVVGNVNVQVILRLYKSRPEVLMAFDLDSCAVGYDGKTVWALPRARRALNGRFNMVDETRPNVKYEARLFKYSERGFAVGVPGMRPDRENVHVNTYASHIDDLSGLGMRSPTILT